MLSISDTKNYRIRCTIDYPWWCTEYPDEVLEMDWTNRTMWSNHPDENPPFHDAAKV